MKNEKTLGEKIREARKKKGLSARDLAKQIDTRKGKLNVGYLSFIENNLAKPSWEISEQIAKVLDMDRNDFLTPLADTALDTTFANTASTVEIDIHKVIRPKKPGS